MNDQPHHHCHCCCCCCCVAESLVWLYVEACVSGNWGASGVKHFCPIIAISDDRKTLPDDKKRKKTRQSL